MKFLYKPVSPWYINQSFGENRNCVDIKTKTKSITCDGHNPPEGFMSTYSQMSGHNGLDLFATRNTPIYSSAEGIVEELVDEKVRGLGLGIITTEKFYCTETKSKEHFKIRYWHNARHNVRLGDRVKVGDMIAWADNTGYSSGDHLHFEIKPVEVKWNKDGSIRSMKNILQKNGYFGAINPLPYIKEENAVSFQGIKSVVEKILWGNDKKDKFTKVLEYGMRNNSDVKELQRVLGVQQTGNYLELTRKAVLNFQLKHKVASPEELKEVNGKRVGKKTLDALNLL